MRIVVLMGGESTERRVSLASGEAVAAGLQRLGHTVYKLDPVFPDEWAAADRPLLTGPVGETPPEDLSQLPRPTPQRIGRLLETIASLAPDVVFPILHGGIGEDGTLQGLLEWAGIPFTGSSSITCKLAMDKAVSKRLFRVCNIPTPAWIYFSRYDNTPLAEISSEIDERIGYPCVVKPNCGGSTVGMSIINSIAELPDAIEAVRKLNDDILIEKYIEGRELTVAVVGDQVLPVVEICPKSGFYDYKSKYTAGNTEYLVPAPIDENVFLRAQDLGKAVWQSLMARGFGRSDFRLSPDGLLYCLELNTLPGMTNLSLVPKAAAAVGIDFDGLLAKILETVPSK
ncbi:MAG: D-alanine--D-alanine ligase [bacterium]|nr:D-alanine--D-alanine ligase [bacterium]